MAWKPVALFLLYCGFLASVKAQNVSSCHLCQENDAVCLDPVNVAILPSSRCNELVYASRSTAVPENGLSAQISNIMLNNVEPRSRSGAEVQYQCAKVSVTINSTDTHVVSQGILRTCVIKAEDVDSMCDFLKEEVTPNYTITYCDVCDSDNCNDSASLSAMVSVVLLSLAGLLFK